MKRPLENEYNEYHHQYISKVRDGDIIKILVTQGAMTVKLLRGINEEKANYHYEPDKWSLKEVVGHIVDIERVFAYRALMFARKNPGPLTSIEQDDLVKGARFRDRTLQSICDEFYNLRGANISLFSSFDEETSLRKGTAGGFQFTVRAIPYILAGHELHHVTVIKERYL